MQATGNTDTNVPEAKANGTLAQHESPRVETGKPIAERRWSRCRRETTRPETKNKPISPGCQVRNQPYYYGVQRTDPVGPMGVEENP